MARTELRITGFGGQGVVLAGHIVGHAIADDDEFDVGKFGGNVLHGGDILGVHRAGRRTA